MLAWTVQSRGELSLDPAVSVLSTSCTLLPHLEEFDFLRRYCRFRHTKKPIIWYEQPFALLVTNDKMSNWLWNGKAPPWIDTRRRPSVEMLCTCSKTPQRFLNRSNTHLQYSISLLTPQSKANNNILMSTVSNGGFPRAPSIESSTEPQGPLDENKLSSLSMLQ